MNVFCVFQTIQVQVYSKDPVIIEEYAILQSIWLNQRDAYKELDKYPELNLHVEVWNAE